MITETSIILFIIKLVLWGFAAIFAILLWAKTRDLSWMFIVAGTVFQYCAIVYDLLYAFGIIPQKFFLIFEIPFFSLFFTVLTPVFYFIAFVLAMKKNKKE
ncbi:MAG: hypothetical protein ACTTHG_07150 [Treponemataceae bacterium]